jgi:hypothetical protein
MQLHAMRELADTVADGVGVRKGQPSITAASHDLRTDVLYRGLLLGEIHLLDGCLDDRFDLRGKTTVATATGALPRQECRKLTALLIALEPTIDGCGAHPGTLGACHGLGSGTSIKRQQRTNDRQALLGDLPRLIGNLDEFHLSRWQRCLNRRDDRHQLVNLKPLQFSGLAVLDQHGFKVKYLVNPAWMCTDLHCGAGLEDHALAHTSCSP